MIAQSHLRTPSLAARSPGELGLEPVVTAAIISGATKVIFEFKGMYDAKMGEVVASVVEKVSIALKAGSPFKPDGGFLREDQEGNAILYTSIFINKMQAAVSSHTAELVAEVDGDLCAKEPWWNAPCLYASEESAGSRMANRIGGYAAASGMLPYQLAVLRKLIYERFDNKPKAKAQGAIAAKLGPAFVESQQQLYNRWKDQQAAQVALMTGGTIGESTEEMPNWLPFAIAGGIALVAAFVWRRKP